MAEREATVISRCVDLSDAKLLSAVGSRTFADTFGHLYQRQDLELFLTQKHSVDCYRTLIANKDFAVWLATDAMKQPIGYAVAGPCGLPAPELEDNAGELTRLYVCEAARGEGLGKRLLDGALVWLEENFDEIYLSVYAHNHGAQRLYRRYGFEKVHDYFFMVGNHADPEFIMKRGALASGENM